jgi:dimeric dUTPase (all-alpha-NTP-PPase superfamily)
MISNNAQQVITVDLLELVFDMQRDLMNKIEENNGSTGTIHGLATALMVETAEFLNEDGSFKFWKKNHTKDPDKIFEEFIDIFFFWVQIAIKSGYTVDQIYQKYQDKWEVNMQRQEDNY